MKILCLVPALMALGSAASAATLTAAPFGRMADGRAVTRYTMTAAGGVQVQFMSYGGAITDVTAPDRRGRPGSVVLGFRTLREYETVGAQNELYFGALLGRTTNWINRGRFTLDGKAYQLSLSDPPNTIHGGVTGFDKRLWTVQPQAKTGTSVSARLFYTSPDGEEGYPGTVKAQITYTLADDGAFTIHYEATTDKATLVNLSNHMSFNLAGAGSPGGVLGQRLTVNAGRYLPLNQSQIPLGRLDTVDGTPFDFRRPTAFGTHIHDKNAQIAIADGYDQCWVLDKRGDPALPQPAVHVFDPQSGRTLDCATTEPGVQIYTGGFFDGSVRGVGGHYGKYAAFTLETQHFPDSPNHPQFPTIVLRPGQVYRSTTVFRFGTQKTGTGSAGF